MKSNMRCQKCGRKRKPSHENKCGTGKAYNKECVKYEVWKEKYDEEMKVKREKEKSEKSKNKENVATSEVVSNVTATAEPVQ